MKKLILFLLFLPIFAHGQKIRVEQMTSGGATENQIIKTDGVGNALWGNDSLTTKVPFIEYDTNYVPTGSEPIGTRYWDADEGTTSLVLPNGVILQDGQELYFDVKNQTGSDLVNGYVAAYAGAVGASGKMKAEYAIANYDSMWPQFTLGVITETIANGADGKVTWFGKVRGIQTDGVNFGEVWQDSTILFLSPYHRGWLTSIMPEAPFPAIPIGVVIKAHSVTGTIDVRPSFPHRLVDAADVNGTPLVTKGQFPVWDQAHKYFDFNYNIWPDIVSDEVYSASWDGVDSTAASKNAIYDIVSTLEPTVTKGDLTESVTGLEFNNTRQVIGGAADLSMSAGYVIPTTTEQSNWNTAYLHSQNDNDLSVTNELNDSIKIIDNYIKVYESGSSIPDSALISITASQVSDFDTEVANNSAVSANTGKDTTGIYHANRIALDLVSGTNTGDVSLIGTGDYLSLSGQQLTKSLIDTLSTHISKTNWDTYVDGRITASGSHPAASLSSDDTSILSLNAGTQAFSFVSSNIAKLNALSTGYIPYKGATNWTNSPIYTNGTNVGIGTTSPGANLDVSGGLDAGSLTVRTTGTTGQTATLNLISGFSGTNGNSYIQANLAELKLYASSVGGINSRMTFYTGYEERMRINSSGNVGIGTTTPGGLLGLKDANTYIDRDGTFNMTFTDAVTGTKTLAELAADNLITNEGSLDVAPGTANTSVITSNTSGSPDITLKAGSNISLSEDADTITITASFTETDPVYTASSWYTTTNNSSNWNTAYTHSQNDNDLSVTNELNDSIKIEGGSFKIYEGGSTIPDSVNHTIFNISDGTGFLKNNGTGTWSYDNSTYLTDAPSNGSYYARKDGAWATFTPGYWTQGTYGLAPTTLSNGIGIGSSAISGTGLFVFGFNDGIKVRNATSDDTHYTLKFTTYGGGGTDFMTFTTYGGLLWKYRAAPVTPSAGYGMLYPYTDGKIYWKNADGTNYDLTANTTYTASNGVTSVGNDFQMDINGLSTTTSFLSSYIPAYNAGNKKIYVTSLAASNIWNAYSLQGVVINATAPTNGQALIYDSSSLTWKPQTISGGSGLWQTLTGAIAPTTITDEVRIGSTTDLGAYILQVTGGIRADNQLMSGTLTITGSQDAPLSVTTNATLGVAVTGSASGLYGTDFFASSSGTYAMTEIATAPSGISGWGQIYTKTDNNLYFKEDNGTETLLSIKDVLKLNPLSSAPSSPSEGWIYVNSTDHHIYCYLNGTWKQLDN